MCQLNSTVTNYKTSTKYIQLNNNNNNNNNKTEKDSKCRLCQQFDETIEHIISACPILAKEQDIKET
jgi:hypothetical protein